MYCSLEDAFPKHDEHASCWSTPVRRRPKTPKPGPSGQQATSVALGANVQAQQLPVIDSHGPFSPHGQMPQQACFASLHHCISCQACQRLMWLHFQQQPAVVMGAQVQQMAPQLTTAPQQQQTEFQRSRGGGALNEPISPGSNVTWGHIFILLAGGALLVMLVDRLKK
jgi:hypothetical protein